VSGVVEYVAPADEKDRPMRSPAAKGIADTGYTRWNPVGVDVVYCTFRIVGTPLILIVTLLLPAVRVPASSTTRDSTMPGNGAGRTLAGLDCATLVIAAPCGGTDVSNRGTLLCVSTGRSPKFNEKSP